MTQLSPAQIEQRRQAARSRWADAAAVAGAGVAGWSIPQAFMRPRAPTEKEARGEFRRQGKMFMTQAKRAGFTPAERSSVWAGQRREAMQDIRATLRPIGSPRTQAIAAAAIAALAAGVSLPRLTNSETARSTREKQANAAVQWGAGVLGGLGALRATMPAMRRVPRTALAAAGAGAAGIAAWRAGKES